MSDGILSHLPTLNAAVSITDERGEQHAVTNRIAWVKRDDVRELLRNPTDEQVDALARVAVEARFAAYRPTNQTITESPVHAMVRAVLAAAAGGDQ